MLNELTKKTNEKKELLSNKISSEISKKELELLAKIMPVSDELVSIVNKNDYKNLPEGNKIDIDALKGMKDIVDLAGKLTNEDIATLQAVFTPLFKEEGCDIINNSRRVNPKETKIEGFDGKEIDNNKIGAENIKKLTQYRSQKQD